jgi:hypothetical protein
MKRHQISISDDTLSRLKALAEPFIDREPEDVIRRLLDHFGQTKEDGSTNIGEYPNLIERSPQSRVPRERGAQVQIGSQRIDAVSVRDLYQQALRLFVENHRSKLSAIVPLKTSSERYLVAREPIHPGGNPFVVPVSFRDFHMEAHKDYKNAIQHLKLLAERLGLTLSYLG